MRFLALSPIVFTLLLGVALADGEDPLPLYMAVTQKKVSVKVVKTAGAGKVYLKMQTRAKPGPRVRFPGTYLRPTGSRHQRLALGYSERTRRGTVAIPRTGTWEGWVTSCCMDAGLNGPNTYTAYAVARKEAPFRIRAIMEHWAGNPDLTQSLVNKYVWGHKKGMPPGTPVTRLNEVYALEGTRLFAWGGRLMALMPGGELLRYRDDKRWECLGAGIATAGVGFGRILARFGRQEVKEFNETERKWVDSKSLRGAETFLPGPGGAFALMGRTLYTLHEKHGWVPMKRNVAGACLSQDREGKYVFVVGTPQGGSTIKRSSGLGAVWTSSQRRGFREVFATASTLYGLTRRGLVRIDREGYRIIRDNGRIFPHRSGLFRLDADGKVEEYKESTHQWKRYGSPGTILDITVDPVTATLYAFTNQGKIVSLVSGGAWKDESSIPEKKKVLNRPKKEEKKK
ncbi:MAG: hypothetical protein ACYTHM_03685 [Planctomycetota bacterium]|jgi:hypothetical protein